MTGFSESAQEIEAILQHLQGIGARLDDLAMLLAEVRIQAANRSDEPLVLDLDSLAWVTEQVRSQHAGFVRWLGAGIKGEPRVH